MLGLVMGAAAGITAGVFMSPEKAQELKGKISGSANDLADNVMHKGEKMMDNMQHKKESNMGGMNQERNFAGTTTGGTGRM